MGKMFLFESIMGRKRTVKLHGFWGSITFGTSEFDNTPHTGRRLIYEDTEGRFSTFRQTGFRFVWERINRHVCKENRGAHIALELGVRPAPHIEPAEGSWNFAEVSNIFFSFKTGIYLGILK